MKDRDPVAEALAEATGGLGGERDLGDEHDCVTSLVQSARCGPQVDLGLAAASHAMKQEALVAALAKRDQQRVERRALSSGEHGSWLPGALRVRPSPAELDGSDAPADRPRLQLDQPSHGQPPEGTVACAGRVRQLRRCQGTGAQDL
jgi:hypothetical protein